MDEKNETAAETVDWSGVEAVANTSEAAIVVGFLQSEGIPARVVDRSFHQTPTTDEDLTPIEVAVPSDRLEEARAILARREVEFGKTREDEVLTDDGPGADRGTPGEGGDR